MLTQWTSRTLLCLLFFGCSWLPAQVTLDSSALSLQFQRLTTEDGLSHNSVRSILEDDQGFIWLGTVDGLNRFDAYEFQAYRHDPSDPYSLPAGEVSALYQDSDGRLWIGLRGQIAWMDELGVFQRLVLPQGQPDDDILEFIPTLDGKFWIVSFFSVYLLDPGPPSAELVLTDADLVFDSELDLTEVIDSLGERLPPEFLETLQEHRFATKVRAFAESPIRMTCEAEVTREGDRWIGCNEGLFRILPGQVQPQRISLESGDGAWLQNYVRALFVDSSDALWVGTQGGLYRLAPNLKPFRNWTGSAERKDLRDWAVSSIFQTPSGDLWLGTFGAGLKRISGSQVDSYPVPDPAPAGCSNVIWDLEEGPEGHLWLATNEGICRFHREHSSYLAGPAELTVRWIQSLFWDAHARLWMGWKGVLDPEGRFFELPEDVIFEHGLAERGGRYLWTAGTNPQITRFDQETLENEHFRPFGENVGQIFVIHEDRLGQLWFGTGEGLFRLRESRQESDFYGIKDGLPGSFVYSIEEDASGRLWLGTNQGLVRMSLDPEGRAQFRQFTPRDGVASTEFNRRASLAGLNGWLYFGGLNGLTAFQTNQIRENEIPPPVVVTAVEYSNREKTFHVDVDGSSDLELSYHDYSVSFEYAALSFQNPEENRYRYRLEGFDPDWVEAGNLRVAKYTNLPAGSYTFRVLGSNDDGVWNLEGASLGVRVSPPFWDTWTFRALLLAAIGAVLLYFHRLRVNHLLQLEKIRSRIAEDLHDDLSTNLSGIALASGVIQKRTGLSDSEKELLGEIENTARQSVESVRQIVWMTDPEHDSLESLVRLMKETCRRLLPNIDWHFQAEKLGDPELSMEVRRDLFLFFKESLHNAVRHSGASHIRIKMRREHSRLELLIKDDGIGFEPGNVSGNGLPNLHRRAANLGGEMKISSQPGQGTLVRLTFELA